MDKSEKWKQEQADLCALAQVLHYTEGMIQFRLEQTTTGHNVYAKFYDCATKCLYGACGRTFAEAVTRAAAKLQEHIDARTKNHPHG